MSRGNPPSLPSLKNPEWYISLLAHFPDVKAHLKFAEQWHAQLKLEEMARNANPIAMAPAGATEAQQYEHYRRIIESRGFKLDASAPTVLAMRGISSDGLSHAAESTRSYDDTMVVLTRDANGDPHVRVIAGSTHPGQRTASVGGSVGVPDVANEQGGAPDGEADVGIILQGEYNLVPRGDHNGAAAWDVRLGDSGALPGYRDTDQDGEFSTAERSASDTRNDTLTGVMIHQGGAQHPQSAGCLNMSSNDYQQFVDAFGGETERGKLIVLDADNVWPT
jgi:hypothetical protein